MTAPDGPARLTSGTTGRSSLFVRSMCCSRWFLREVSCVAPFISMEDSGSANIERGDAPEIALNGGPPVNVLRLSGGF